MYIHVLVCIYIYIQLIIYSDYLALQILTIIMMSILGQHFTSLGNPWISRLVALLSSCLLTLYSRHSLYLSKEESGQHTGPVAYFQLVILARGKTEVKSSSSATTRTHMYTSICCCISYGHIVNSVYYYYYALY